MSCKKILWLLTNDQDEVPEWWGPPPEVAAPPVEAVGGRARPPAIRTFDADSRTNGVVGWSAYETIGMGVVNARAVRALNLRGTGGAAFGSEPDRVRGLSNVNGVEYDGPQFFESSIMSAPADPTEAARRIEPSAARVEPSRVTLDSLTQALRSVERQGLQQDRLIVSHQLYGDLMRMSRELEGAAPNTQNSTGLLGLSGISIFPSDLLTGTDAVALGEDFSRTLDLSRTDREPTRRF